MRKSQEKSKKVEGNKKEANKKEHCLSASRVFDSAHGFLGGISALIQRKHNAILKKEILSFSSSI